MGLIPGIQEFKKESRKKKEEVRYFLECTPEINLLNTGMRFEIEIIKDSN